MRARVVIATSSRHGSTHEVGDWAAHAISTKFPETIAITRIHCGSVGQLCPSDFEAAIIGGSIYAGRWPRSGRAFVRTNLAALQVVPVWAFSASLGDRKPSRDLRPVAGQRLEVVSHASVGGVVNSANLRSRERAFINAMRVKDTDTRSREDVEAWAVSIGAEIANSLR